MAQPTIAALREGRLSVGFYQRDHPLVARALLGCVLVHGERAGVIVETEAYGGASDLASHARFGPTDRNRVMFGPGGVSYVYLCYGVHQMFNIVTSVAGDAGAVLVRAIAPLVGLPADPAVGRGPGKATRALGLSRAQHGLTLDGDQLFVARGQRVAAARVSRGPRVGVGFAGQSASFPLRYSIEGHPSVSKP